MPEYNVIVCTVPKGRRQDWQPGPKPWTRELTATVEASCKQEARRAAALKYPHKQGYRIGRVEQSDA